MMFLVPVRFSVVLRAVVAAPISTLTLLAETCLPRTSCVCLLCAFAQTLPSSPRRGFHSLFTSRATSDQSLKICARHASLNLQTTFATPATSASTKTYPTKPRGSPTTVIPFPITRSGDAQWPRAAAAAAATVAGAAVWV